MDATIYSVTPRGERWPALLRELPEKAKPKKLFVKGALPPADALVISIVGTRKPTSYGRELASQIVRALAPFRVVVASGMAIGIDAIAHRTALEEKLPTLAFLGCGLDESVIYPRENLMLARNIISGGGAVISEYEHDQKAALWTFPERNRIIAGIAHALIVVEAGEKSGALITAR
ncbi:MAG: DNA-protecting protein DprA, partial [Candidatus Ryanbacteria bacterium]|nr:DNA-protecting protein DprA [Candidatus Ryanbacteria bacterium]